MGREVRRVPLDFDWPLDKVWVGFVTPDSLYGWKCPECEQGQTFAAWWLSHMCHRIAMLADDVLDQRRGRPMHPWLAEDRYPYGIWEGKPRRWVVKRPSEDMIALMKGLGCKPSILGFGSGDGHRVYRAITEAAGVDFGVCQNCAGEGEIEAYPGQFSERAAWMPYDPPTGDGWQLWETVSEGSPISPVFASAEGLAGWMASDAYTWGVSRPMQYDAALRFVSDGWAPSMVFTPETGLVSGEKFVGGVS